METCNVLVVAALIGAVASDCPRTAVEVLDKLRQQLSKDLDEVQTQVLQLQKSIIQHVQEGLVAVVRSPAQSVKSLADNLQKDLRRAVGLAQGDYQKIAEEIRAVIDEIKQLVTSSMPR